ncbi:MAG: biotin--[acetyl-CoA-carboxylase] ligase [Planctomycetota bacterium]
MRAYSSVVQFTCIHHDVVDSTSERAFAALALGSARHGDVHLANGQTAGRGRLGRRWSSTHGEGLYLSVILLPPPPPWPAPALTIAAGLAVLDAAHALGAREATLDWPNDVVVCGAKLAGILVETRGLDATRPHYVVGIGVNVLQRTFDAELERERAVTSLALQGCAATVADTTSALLAALARRLDEVPARPLELAREYVRAAGWLERVVRVRTSGGTDEGRLLGISLERGFELMCGGATRHFALEFVHDIALATH